MSAGVARYEQKRMKRTRSICLLLSGDDDLRWATEYGVKELRYFSLSSRV